MKMTDGAKEVLEKSMKEHDCDCLRITVEPGCCGASLNFTLDQLKSGEHPITINDISVIMDEQAQEQTDALTINADDGELVIDGGSCDCGSSDCC
jgi:Fe-S cluster assembly iron-binding protein IscA